MNTEQTKLASSLILSFTFLLLGASFILGANVNAIGRIVDFYQVNSLLSVELAATLIGLSIVTAGLLVSFSLFSNTARPYAIILLALVSAVPLLSLLSESRWMTQLGGFPVIGSGQGIIKYFALMPVLMFLFFKEQISSRVHVWFNFAAVASVLIWIGSMKFYAFEAKGIEPLVANSPLMSWMYQVWDLQTVSNIIGVYDLFAVIVLAAGIAMRHQLLLIIGFATAAAVFVTTQTFIFTTGGGVSSETLLTGLSQFVIKDLWYVINLLIIAHFTLPQQQN